MTPLELAWFAPSCTGDTARLGVDDPSRRATFAYNRDVVLGAERAGFDNVLIPSSFVPGMDPWTLAAALAPALTTIRLLPAGGSVSSTRRCSPARQEAPATPRRAAHREHHLQRAGRRDPRLGGALPPHGRGDAAAASPLDRGFRHPSRERWQYRDFSTAPTRLPTPPPMYFGGTSEPAREVAAKHADCYLMWIEGIASIGSLVAEMRERAAAHGRTLRFGLRTHVIVRDTEAEAPLRRPNW
ncbi:MAG: LLM class flavin-dependent oxidoreductase [Ilumatobacteraceae bacterium]